MSKEDTIVNELLMKVPELGPILNRYAEQIQNLEERLISFHNEKDDLSKKNQLLTTMLGTISYIT